MFVIYKRRAKVVFTDINEEAGKKFEKELGENAAFLKHDVSRVEDGKI